MTKMYEDYLEEFIFKTSQLIASKLFGKVKNDDDITEDVKDSVVEDTNDKASGDAQETTMKDNDAVTTDVQNKDDDNDYNEEINKNDETNDDDNEENLEVIDDNVRGDANTDVNSQIENISNTENDRDVDAELDKLLKETMEKNEKQNAERMKELAAARFEYDHINVGLNNINFHLPLIFLLFILTILNMPSVVTWARNYQYAFYFYCNFSIVFINTFCLILDILRY